MKGIEIYETENFLIEAVEKPHIDRNDGGHIVIKPKVAVSSRQNLSPNQAIELMRLTIIAGKAMTEIMNKHGVEIGRINYQDNGNWGVFDPEGPKLHIHLYGRAKNAKIQKYGQACYFPHINDDPGFYEKLKPLNSKDIEELKKEIKKSTEEGEFSNEKWGL